MRNDRKDSRLYEYWAKLVERDESDISQDPSGFSSPNGDEKALLGHVPGVLKQSCTRNGDPASGSLAATECHPAAGAGADLVIYQSFPSADAMNTIYNNYITNSGVARESGEAGACPREGTYSVPGKTVGHVLCFVKDQYAFIVWTDDAQLILSVGAATATATGPLNDWWKDDSGPI